MGNHVFSEENIHNKLASIIREIANVDVTDPYSSLFSSGYYLSPELVVYLLLEVSKEFNFDIHDEFIISLGNYSYNDLANAIIKQSKQIVN